jgi:hypothetical protein
MERIIGKAIEKDRDLRYQHAADMRADLKRVQRDSGSGERAAEPKVGPRARIRLFKLLAAGAATLTAFLAWWNNPIPDPKALGVFQVTATGKQDYLVRPATDGVRIFYTRHSNGSYNLMQASVNGGAEEELKGPFPNTLIWDVSPDGSRYLITSFILAGAPTPLWVWPATGGAPSRLNDLVGSGAVWSPDGQRIAFHAPAKVWLAQADGSGKRELADFGSQGENEPDWISWSPDGRKIRFTVGLRDIWEVQADGTGLHKVPMPVAS